MKVDEALNIISEAVRNGEIYNLKQALIKPLKKAYGVEELIFWKDNSNWFYCGFVGPNRSLWSSSLDKVDDFDDLLYYLKSLNEGKSSVFFEGRRYESLNDLRQEILIRKLAGIEDKELECNGR